MGFGNQSASRMEYKFYEEQGEIKIEKLVPLRKICEMTSLHACRKILIKLILIFNHFYHDCS